MFDESCNPLNEYGRPIYGLNNLTNASSDELPFEADTAIDKMALIFSGSRWLLIRKEGAGNLTTEELKELRSDYHA